MTTPIDGRVLWTASPERLARSGVGDYLRWLAERGTRLTTHHDLWSWSVADLDRFWSSIWGYFELGPRPDAPALASAEMPGAVWFPGAALNYAEVALRRRVDDHRDVIIAHSETRPEVRITRGELRSMVHRVANGLRSLGVGPGDVVAGYLPNIPEAVIGLLATASIGAIWTGCPPEYGPDGVLSRLRQVDPRVIIGVDGYRHRAVNHDRLGTLLSVASQLDAIPVVVRYLGTTGPTDALEWRSLLDNSDTVTYEPVAFDHPLWVLYSSGTTGPPKALVHGHGGIVLEHMKALRMQHDIGDGDRMLWYTSTAWMIWNLSVSGLLVGADLVLFDGHPLAEDHQVLWRLVERERVTRMSLGASLLTELANGSFQPLHDTGSLGTLGATGSVLPISASTWVYDTVMSGGMLAPGSGGTEVCSAFVAASIMTPVRAGRISGRALGVDVAAVDEHGRDVIGVEGELVIRQPMPSMPLRIWGDDDHTRLRATYFETYPGWWRHGDRAVFFEDGSCAIIGRSDATLNRGGVRIGTAEFYGVLDRLEALSDSVVVHLDGSDLLVAIVVAVDGSADPDEISELVRRSLRAALSPRHVPDRVVLVDALPRTLTGKRAELPIKRILSGVPVVDAIDPSSVTNPSALAEIAALRFV